MVHHQPTLTKLAGLLGGKKPKRQPGGVGLPFRFIQMRDLREARTFAGAESGGRLPACEGDLYCFVSARCRFIRGNAREFFLDRLLLP